jgi:hypothetical protein
LWRARNYSLAVMHRSSVAGDGATDRHQGSTSAPQ